VHIHRFDHHVAHARKLRASGRQRKPRKFTDRLRPIPNRSLPLPSVRGFAPFFPVMANPTNVLSSGIEIIGSIRFSNDMIIDGKVEGEITSDKGRVTIGENALIKGDVTAGEVKVYGKVEGKITSERCELKDKSRINGDIKSKVFSMEEGASLSGRTEIGG
jgi:cytoskeletal protein CcmA (bactofilin family)